MPCSLGKNDFTGLRRHARETEKRGPAMQEEKKGRGVDEHGALSATVEAQWQIVLYSFTRNQWGVKLVLCPGILSVSLLKSVSSMF